MEGELHVGLSLCFCTHLGPLSAQTIAEEFERRAVDLEEFLDRFTNAQGRFSGIKHITRKIKHERDTPASDAVPNVFATVGTAVDDVGGP